MIKSECRTTQIQSQFAPNLNAASLKTVLILIIITAFFYATPISLANEIFGPEDLLTVKTCTGVALSPDGLWAAYTVRVQRTANEKPGSAYSELYLVNTQSGEIRPFITGQVNISSLQWNPDGTQISFLSERGENARTQVWAIPLNAGEARQITFSKTSVSTYRWHPSGKKLAYIATVAKSEHEQNLTEKGYDFIYYEENLKPRELYLIEIDQPEKIKPLIQGKAVWSFEFSTDGGLIAAALSDKNLIDHRYMFQKVHLLIY